MECAKGRQLHFLANVDPTNVVRNTKGLKPETTLVVVVSKTFTTPESMLNARTMREWISFALGLGHHKTTYLMIYHQSLLQVLVEFS
ncbi:hypothetical protein SLEP1_g38773 [Rubroshorea leprosula]|uniref:Uncharacterized protein n=1 Tax=Rubroshorea leprosula TaxID=152421 RepID=A0AAV5KYH0_9ROSI|nr:hypothetical protein SLEP1_g38773 [Rubroshorea leprosula]